jgi:hypothetical protein
MLLLFIVVGCIGNAGFPRIQHEDACTIYVKFTLSNYCIHLLNYKS